MNYQIPVDGPFVNIFFVFCYAFLCPLGWIYPMPATLHGFAGLMLMISGLFIFL